MLSQDWYNHRDYERFVMSSNPIPTPGNPAGPGPIRIEPSGGGNQPAGDEIELPIEREDPDDVDVDEEEE